MDLRDSAAAAALANQAAAEDIRAKLEALQEKLHAQRGVSAFVHEQNDFVGTSIEELDAMDPAAQKLAKLQAGMGVDSSQQLNEAIARFTMVKAHLSRLVASQEEMIIEI